MYFQWYQKHITSQSQTSPITLQSAPHNDFLQQSLTHPSLISLVPPLLCSTPPILNADSTQYVLSVFRLARNLSDYEEVEVHSKLGPFFSFFINVLRIEFNLERKRNPGPFSQLETELSRNLMRIIANLINPSNRNVS